MSFTTRTPLLIQCLTSLPELILHAKVNYSLMSEGRSEWIVGDAFLKDNVKNLQHLLVLSRSVVLVLGVLAGATLYWWTLKRFGIFLAAVSASLWFFDPSVLAFSGVVTPDVGATLFALLASIAFQDHLTSPRKTSVLLSGTLLGLALASKFSLIVLVPAWAIAAGIVYAVSRPALRQTVIKQVSDFILICSMSLVVLNSLYLFEGTLTPLGEYHFKSYLLTGK